MRSPSYTTTVSRLMNAPRGRIYAALLDADRVAEWLHPPDMTCVVHRFEPWAGGRFRISLSYVDPSRSSGGKSTQTTDTFGGRFVELVPDERVVQAMEFESADAAMRGEMTITVTLVDSGGGTLVTWEHANVPESIPAEDNELGTRMTLDNLAAVVERR